MNWIWLLPLLLLLLFNNGGASRIIETLPGYSGTLPFKLETGYIGVGENDEVQLFYYFIESENNPKTDPLLLWITGGPGCSGLSTLVYEIGISPLHVEECYQVLAHKLGVVGPFTFDVTNSDGNLPYILLNPYSWTKVASIIFLDWPAGTGFSYANTSKGYSNSDTKSVKDNYTFLRKWLLNHPTFIKNRLYLAGESYGAKLVPMVAMEILRGNEGGLEPRMSLHGYIIGNALTDPNIDINERIPYVHRMSLISDEYYNSAKIGCNGKYYNPAQNNVQCLHAIKRIQKCIKHINLVHILESFCEADDLRWDQTFLQDDSIDHLVLPGSKQDPQWCRTQNYLSSRDWANDPTVQEALHIRKEMITRWKRCNLSLSYEDDIVSALEYHKSFTKKGYHVLVFSGDHDMAGPYMGTLKWIRMLNLTVDDDWRPWHVNGQVAGYTEKYKESDFFLTFATIKGAGHTAPEYKPEECHAMFCRWLFKQPL